VSFVIECPCGQKMTVEDQHVGQEVACVRCSQVLRVPQKPPEGETAAAQPSRELMAEAGAGASSQSEAWSGASQVFLKPHRGTLILTLGILSFVCCGLLAIPAWIMGNTDLAEMRAGRMDRAGEGLTNAGRILGIIETVFMLIALVVIGLMSVLGLGLGFTGIAD